MPATALPVSAYGNRVDMIEALCRGQRVLDMGCVAMTLEPSDQRVSAFPSSLHMRLKRVASSLVGLDYSADEIAALAARHPDLALIAGDAECPPRELADLGPFDVIVFGNLIEHLTNPGKALDAMRSLLATGGRVIVTCPNALGGPNFGRFALGRFVEGPDHVLSFNRWTLQHLLERHGFAPTSVATSYDHTPERWTKRLLVNIGSVPLRLRPEFGGTLVMVARLASPDLVERAHGFTTTLKR